MACALWSCAIAVPLAPRTRAVAIIRLRFFTSYLSFQDLVDLPCGRSFELLKRGNDLAVRRLGESFQRRRAHVAEHSKLKVEASGNRVIRSLVNRHDVVLPDCQIERR